MKIVNFFEKMAGRWFSQRTTHALSSQQSKAGKSDLEVAFLAADAPEVQQLYQQMDQQMDQQVDKQIGSAANTGPICGLQVQQSSTVEGDTKPTLRTTLLVPLGPTDPAEDGPHEGTLLRSGSVGTSPQTGTYSLDEEVLTITTKTPGAESIERLWFINENLRMRTGITELESGLRIASFCSEIRMGGKPPKEE